MVKSEKPRAKRHSATSERIRDESAHNPFRRGLVLVPLSRAVDCCLETLGVRNTLVPPPPPPPTLPPPRPPPPPLRRATTHPRHSVRPSRDSPPINFLRAPSDTLSLSRSPSLTWSLFVVQPAPGTSSWRLRRPNRALMPGHCRCHCCCLCLYHRFLVPWRISLPSVCLPRSLALRLSLSLFRPRAHAGYSFPLLVGGPSRARETLQ